MNFLKHNFFVVELYNKYLDWCCRNVDKFIFVATTGRSATSSLTHIFSAVNNAACFHEPHPNMINASDLLDVYNEKKYYHNLFRVLKRVYIKRAASGHKYYLETNHLFIKNFIAPAVKYFGEKIIIIHLIRDPISVASSFFAIDSIPGKTERGEKYLLDPEQEDNIFNLNIWQHLKDSKESRILRCLWYWYEIEARIEQYKKKYPAIMWYRIETENLNNYEKVSAMLQSLNIAYSDHYLKQTVGIKKNKKQSEKVNSVSRDTVLLMNEQLLSYFAEEGHVLKFTVPKTMVSF